MAIHYRIERNPLTKPGTWRLRFIRWAAMLNDYDGSLVDILDVKMA